MKMLMHVCEALLDQGIRMLTVITIRAQTGADTFYVHTDPDS